MPVKMTERAAKQVQEVFRSKSLPDSTMLRIEAEPGTDEDKFELALKLDTQEPREDDNVESTEGTRLVIQNELSKALGDSQLDFKEESGGFVLERVQ